MPQTEKLLNWYDANHRNLPWRNTKDPYKIWLSEIILQQTRVDQGLNYYLKFTETFPDINYLAKAGEDEILKLWQGLGYYSRARNLHAAAKMLSEKYNGVFPETYDDMLKLKGIGPYTAAAIASIVFDEIRPVVDGNVMRVISRWFAIEEAVNSASGARQIKEALDRLIDKSRPGQFNQAMMEFGAVYCKPKNPDCIRCIFKDQCLAFQKDIVALLPRKKPTLKIRHRFFNYFFIKYDQQGERFTFLKKRRENDIWKGLYEFPLVETLKETNIDELLDSGQPIFQGSIDHAVIESSSKPYLHQLTHQKIHARFTTLLIQNQEIQTPAHYQKIPLSSLRAYPVPRLMDKYLTDCGF